MAQGPAFVHQTNTVPGQAAQGPELVHQVAGIPTLVQGPAFVHQPGSIPTQVQGPAFIHEALYPKPSFGGPSGGYVRPMSVRGFSGPTSGKTLIPPPQHFTGSTSGRVPVTAVRSYSGPTFEVANISPPRHFSAATTGSVHFNFLFAPTHLVATPVAVSKISLTWTDTTADEDGFRIERSPNGQGAWDVIGTVGADVVIFVDTGAVPLTVYDYRVIAFRDVIESAPSNVVSSFSPAPGGPPPPPSAGPLPFKVLEFLSAGVYGVERNPDGNTGGTKF